MLVVAMYLLTWCFFSALDRAEPSEELLINTISWYANINWIDNENKFNQVDFTL